MSRVADRWRVCRDEMDGCRWMVIDTFGLFRVAGAAERADADALCLALNTAARDWQNVDPKTRALSLTARAAEREDRQRRAAVAAKKAEAAQRWNATVASLPPPPGMNLADVPAWRERLANARSPI